MFPWKKTMPRLCRPAGLTSRDARCLPTRARGAAERWLFGLGASASRT